MQKENVIREYFQSWLEQNRQNYDNIFDKDVIYTECYGPEYHGIAQVKQWFDDWNKKGNVIEWTIKRIINKDMFMVVEWYFKCNYKGEISDFDGCSIIEFNDNNHIISLKEFESKSLHIYPYGK